MRLYTPYFPLPSPRRAICLDGRRKPLTHEERLASAIRKKGELATLGDLLEELHAKKHMHDQMVGNIVRHFWMENSET